MVKEGDHVVLETTKGVFEGLLMPGEDGLMIIKLKTGYNVCFGKNNILKLKLLKSSPKKKSSFKIASNKSLPRIVILHTGGTIASKVDYDSGGVIARFEPEELLSMFPELLEIANVESRFVRNMWSEDMRFGHYNIIAKTILEEIKKGCEGIIIAHGTDTLHYSAAALSFMLENLSIPVLLVGAQRSSDRASSDAGVNLVCASEFITKTDFAGVAICMHDWMSDDSCMILPATKTRKFHTSRRDAFRVVNGYPVGRVNYFTRKIELFSRDYSRKSDHPVKLFLFNEKVKVGIIKIHPNMFAKEFAFYGGYDGLVIEGFGLAGNVPINEIDSLTKEHTKIAQEINRLVKNGTVVVATSQTIYGSINMNVYSTGRKMQEIGVVGNYLDITTETAFVKLAWLLSNFKKSEVSRMFMINLRGEILSRECLSGADKRFDKQNKVG